MKYIAHDIHFAIQDDIATVAFRAEDEQHYLMLSRQLYPTSQDCDLGQYQIYVELDDQAFSVYGGIEMAEFYRNKLCLLFNHQATESLGIPSLTVSIDLISERFAQLKGVIQAVFDGHRNFGMIA